MYVHEVGTANTIQDRYEVRPIADRYVIRDMALRAFCSLDGKTVLEWTERSEAEAWLRRCYRAWGHNPNVGDHPNDGDARSRNRRKLPPGTSPWSHVWYDR